MVEVDNRGLLSFGQVSIGFVSCIDPWQCGSAFKPNIAQHFAPRGVKRFQLANPVHRGGDEVSLALVMGFATFQVLVFQPKQKAVKVSQLLNFRRRQAPDLSPMLWVLKNLLTPKTFCSCERIPNEAKRIILAKNTRTQPSRSRVFNQGRVHFVQGRRDGSGTHFRVAIPHHFMAVGKGTPVLQALEIRPLEPPVSPLLADVVHAPKVGMHP